MKTILILLVVISSLFARPQHRLSFFTKAECAATNFNGFAKGGGFSIERVNRDMLYYIEYSGNYMFSVVSLDDDVNNFEYDLEGIGSVHRVGFGSGLRIPSKTKLKYELTGEIGIEIFDALYSGNLAILYKMYNLDHKVNFKVENSDIDYRSVYFATSFKFMYTLNSKISIIFGPKLYFFSGISNTIKMNLPEEDGFKSNQEIILPITYEPIFLGLFLGFVGGV